MSRGDQSRHRIMRAPLGLLRVYSRSCSPGSHWAGPRAGAVWRRHWQECSEMAPAVSRPDSGQGASWAAGLCPCVYGGDQCAQERTGGAAGEVGPLACARGNFLFVHLGAGVGVVAGLLCAFSIRTPRLGKLVAWASPPGLRITGCFAGQACT